VLRTDKNGEHTQPYVAEPRCGKERHDGVPEPSAPKHVRNFGHERHRHGSGSSSEPDASKVPSRSATDEKDNPLEKSLDQKMLPKKKPEHPFPACSTSRWKSKD